MHDLVSIHDIDRTEIEKLLKQAALFKKKGIPIRWGTGVGGGEGAESKIVATLFFEASTRTRLSFEAAAQRLGASVIGFDDPAATSHAQKGESLEDTIRMIDAYADLLVIRHPEEESLKIAAEVAEHPVVNAGNGTDEHPTQVLTDLFTIQERQKKLDGLTIAIVGDLKYGRVPHSLALALKHFDTKQIWVHPPQLPMPEEIREQLEGSKTSVETTGDLQYAVQHADVVYMTRVQAERFDEPEQYDALKDAFVLTPEMMAHAKDSGMVMHALPRRYELPETIDAFPQTAYFEQAANAVFMRAAIIDLLLS
jgi:aspartate carbamoyltransferase catalytic subunit